MEGFNGVLFCDFCFREALVVIEIDEVGGSIVLTSLSAFWAISGEMSHFSTLETGIRLVSHGGSIALEVILRSIPLVAVGVLPSAEVIASVVSSIVSSGWGSIPIYVHRDWGVVHPPGGVRRVVLGCALSLRAIVIPLRAWLLGSEGSEVSVSSEYVPE